jgi:hypothetical protein
MKVIKDAPLPEKSGGGVFFLWLRYGSFIINVGLAKGDAMGYRNKEETLKEAERLGIDVEGLDWATMQKVVKEALMRESLGMSEPKEKKSFGEVPKEIIGKEVLIAPEMAPARYRIGKYEEEVGYEMQVEPNKVEFGNGQSYQVQGNMVTGSVKVKSKGNRRVIAESSVPKENAGMLFRPGIDPAVVVTWDGKTGFLWTHFRLPNVKDLLQQAGVLGKYKEYFDSTKHPGNVWYAAGKMLVCDPYVVLRILDEIERDAQIKKKLNGGY